MARPPPMETAEKISAEREVLRDATASSLESPLPLVFRRPFLAVLRRETHVSRLRVSTKIFNQ